MSCYILSALIEVRDIQCGPAEVQPLVLSPKVWMWKPRFALESWPVRSHEMVVGSDSEACSNVTVPATLESPRRTATTRRLYISAESAYLLDTGCFLEKGGTEFHRTASQEATLMSKNSSKPSYLVGAATKSMAAMCRACPPRCQQGARKVSLLWRLNADQQHTKHAQSRSCPPSARRIGGVEGKPNQCVGC